MRSGAFRDSRMNVKGPYFIFESAVGKGGMAHGSPQSPHKTQNSPSSIPQTARATQGALYPFLLGSEQ